MRNKPHKAEPNMIRTETLEKAKESIWNEEPRPSKAWEEIRGSSFCAVKANIPRLFKEEQ